jgi:hypothetical protein
MYRILAIIQILLGSLILGMMSLSVHAEDKSYVDNVGNNYGKGKTFFDSKVLPKLAENGCLKCHARGYLRPNVLVYEELIRRLAIGDSAENNAIIYKIANIRSISPQIPNHPGGQRCTTIDAEPCKTIRQWWEIEFGHKEIKKIKPGKTIF